MILIAATGTKRSGAVSQNALVHLHHLPFGEVVGAADFEGPAARLWLGQGEHRDARHVNRQ